ncbi:hypothetical protein [Corallococcus exercitus]|uniref:hypothetical protein n=1 Tax=Corallococcus exercitus TaxID=2316736 RepID=UPI0035D5207F
MPRALLATAWVFSVSASAAEPASNTPVIHPDIASRYERFVKEAGALPSDAPLEHPWVMLKGKDGTVVVSKLTRIPDDMANRRGVRYQRHGGEAPVDLFTYVIFPMEDEEGAFHDPELPVPFNASQRLFRRFLLEREGYTAIPEGKRDGTGSWRVTATGRGLILRLPGVPERRLLDGPDAPDASDCAKKHGTRIVRSVAFKNTTFAEVEHPLLVGDWEGGSHCMLRRTLLEVRRQGVTPRILCDGEACEQTS